jgi:hypothetical protein
MIHMNTLFVHTCLFSSMCTRIGYLFRTALREALNVFWRHVGPMVDEYSLEYIGQSA